jgi:hypothetical protein
MASKDIINPTDINNPSSTRRTADLLPAYHRTDRNIKFLASTLDQYVQQPEIKRVNGFMGSKVSPNFNPAVDQYIEANTQLRTNYQLEPSLIISDVDENIKLALGYDDLIGQLAFNEANTKNLDRLFRPKSYSYDPMIDWDKFVNFRRYYWLPTGPDRITISGKSTEITSTYSVKDSQEGNSLVFSPGGDTRNPLLTLYRGQTYIFNIDSKYPFYVKTAYVAGEQSLYAGTTNNGLKSGQVIVSIDEFTPSTLFYFAEGNPSAVGQISVKSIEESTSLDVEKDILGKVTYTSENGIAFSNGMKIRFVGNITPESYADKEWIVEGVGSAIRLVDFAKLVTVGYETTNLNPNFDANPFDEYPFDDFSFVPLTPDYITINRSAPDLNPWSKYNRWVHEDVITATAKANGVPPVYPSDKRGQRPIIEFMSGLQLHNFGSVSKDDIDLIDNKTTNVFKIVEGSPGYYVDGIQLEAGFRVIFNADTDPLVRGKVYEVKIEIIEGEQAINLEEVADSIPLFKEGVTVRRGNEYKGTCWWFNGDTWQFGQQKAGLNQAPLWAVYDSEGNDFSDQAFYNTAFNGTKIFGYKEGTVTDSVLGLNLAYRNINNVGEYLFSNYFMTDTFTNFVNGSVEILSVSNGYLKVNQSLFENNLRTVWTRTIDKPIPIIQYQVITEDTISIELTAIRNPGYARDLTVDVFVNNDKKDANIEFVRTVDGARSYIVSTSKFSVNDRVMFKLYTSQTPTDTGYYEVPINLSNNPLNGAIDDFTFTEVSDHVKTMIEFNGFFSGEFPGTSNLRDLGNISQYGSRLVTHLNPLSFAHYFLGTKEHNAIDAIRYVSDDYNQFKANFLRAITELKGVYTPAQSVDLALIRINSQREDRVTYNYSDMLAFGKNNITRYYTVTDSRNIRYSLTSIFDDTVLSERSVLIYLNNVLLVKGYDYEFNKFDPSFNIKVSLKKGDIITVLDYQSTAGGFVPPTPTKLGLYPKFKPEIFFDDTYAGEPQKVIQGHDGSITVAYNDYRDDILLEFETRIYNNLKVDYNPSLLNINEILPGAFRTGINFFNNQEATDLITSDFLRWAGFYGVDYITNNTLDELNSFTFNYTGTIDTLNKNPLNGYWRSIYKYFFDTDRPHTHPWEMLGFSEEPSWWISVYGPAPYTSGNQILWRDLEEGRIAVTPNGPQINSLYARPGLSRFIPVGESGELLSPTDSGLSSTPIVNPNDPKRIVILRNEQIASKWKIGDWGPAETAWRRSSYWPFACQVLMALARPADYASLMFDPSRLKKNFAGEIKYTENNSFLNPSKVVLFGETINDQRVLASGYSVFVIEKEQADNPKCIEEIKSDLGTLTYKLMTKLGGFASKEKLQVGIDAVDPTSPYPGVLIPSEDYEIFFNQSSPIESLGISGLIVQKTTRGFSIRGYDKFKPYFTVFKPFASNLDQTERVGGVSEPFTNWAPNRIYNEGEVLFFTERYYRVIQRHNSGPTFNSQYYRSLPSLPVVGGVGVLRRTNFDTTETVVPYGVEYSTIQEVYDLILGYGKWLESKGFVFEEFNKDLDQILDWKFTAKEFLYWTTQNWAPNAVITLSPFANKLVFRSDKGIVDSIVNTFYEYSLLKADGAPFPKENFTVVRLDGEFVLNTMNTQEGLFYARINLVQKEHALVMNNFTLFNDVIYDVETGYRQRRIKLKGFITSNWNGDFFSPGFVFDQAVISDWHKFQDYSVGDVVRFSGKYFSAIKSIPGSETFNITNWALLNEKPTPQLLPNFDYKINQFEDFYSLDIDNFDIGQQAMAQHLVGYTPRPYLNYIIGDPIAQYKFYQGFIREKGSRNSLDNLSKASLSRFNTSIDFNEEWAFRIGYYGGFNTYQEMEVGLESTKFIENPQIIEFTKFKPLNPANTYYYKDEADVIVKPEDFDINSVFSTSTDNIEDIFKMPIAGYVRFDDVTATAYNTNSVLDIANNSSLKTGSTIWLGFKENGEWDVLRVTEVPTIISAVSINVPSQSLIFTTFFAHQLVAGELVSVTNVGNGIDQIYVVQQVLSQNQFVVLSTLVSLPDLNDPLIGSLYVFRSSRLSSFNDLSQIPYLDRWEAEEKVWVDDNGSGKWAVYKKIKNFDGILYEADVPTVSQQHYGSKIASRDDTNVVITSAPSFQFNGSDQIGRVFISFRDSFNELQPVGNFIIDDNGTYYAKASGQNETLFGHSLAFDPSQGKNLVVIGAPATSNVASTNTETTATHIIDQSQVIASPSGIRNQGLVKLVILSTVTNRLLDNYSIGITTYNSVTGTNYGQSISLSIPLAHTTTFRISTSTGIQVGDIVTGTYISGFATVTNVTSTSMTLSRSQFVNTSSVVYFSNKAVGQTRSLNTTLVYLNTTTGISINSQVFGEYITGANVRVLGIDSSTFSIVLDQPQTISTASQLTFNNTSTSLYTLGTKQKLYVGAPATDAVNTTTEGHVYVYDLDVSNTTSSAYISVTTGTIASLSQAPWPNTRSQFGFSISGNKALTKLAVAAPTYATSTSTAFGAIYIYDFIKGDEPVQLIKADDFDLPVKFTEDDIFAEKIEMSKDGQFLVVASPRAFDSSLGRRSGVVDTFVWNETSQKFEYSQRISMPISALTTTTVFGYDISLNESADTLVITSVGGAKTPLPTFDKYTKRYSTATIQTIFGADTSRYINDPDSNQRKTSTTFDGNATTFKSRLLNAGTAHVYNRLGFGVSRWAHAEQLNESTVASGSMFGYSALALNNYVYIGAPAKLLNGTNGLNTGTGQIFSFEKIDTNKNSWDLFRIQEPLVDLNPIKRAITIDSNAEQVQSYIDIIDPIKGSILGTAAEELRYITSYDPAVYSLGIAGVTVDSNTNWLDEHVGELWWDLSTVKYVWYEQGELDYRKNNWNNVFPGSQIDVYEWVRSEYLPAEWSQLADTSEGLTLGISGQPKFIDNSVVSIKQVYNSVSNSFVNVYYYWVKNKTIVPAGVKNRNRAAFEVAQQIADPIGVGSKFLAIISPTSMVLANAKTDIASENINLNITFDYSKDTVNRHTEWTLIQENDPNSLINPILDKKLLDSLLGRDSLGNPVPEPTLPAKLKYGIQVRPRQSMFVDRKQALRNIIEFVNSVLINEQITGSIDFGNLNKVEPFPDNILYDTVVEDIFNLELIVTRSFVTAELRAVVNANGGIESVEIVNPGFGYISSPLISITADGLGAELFAELDTFGSIINVNVVEAGKNYSSDNLTLTVRPYTVLVQTDINSGGKWALYEWNKDRNSWIKIRTQTYNTAVYWKYVNWVEENFDPLQTVLSTVASPYALEALQILPEGSYVRVQNGGDGRSLVLRKTNGVGGTFEPDWDIVHYENGTIQILDSLWNTGSTLFGWDEEIGFDQTQYDQSPDDEINFILKSIKEDIFIDQRKGYWNQLFFKAVRYAMTEQKFLDWAIKTTFISAISRAGELDQPPTFNIEQSKFYEDFLDEVKPYHTKIRKFTESYSKLELTNTFNTDFDLPSYWNTTTQNFNVVRFGNDLMQVYPWKAWFNNYGYQIESINLFDGGEGYTQIPKVTIVPAPGDTGRGAEAVAFISLGKVTQIIVTNPGEGYTSTPLVVISGGGSTSLTPARAYAQLGNNPVRSNYMRLKFDRVTANREVGNQNYTQQWISDGVQVSFGLDWAPLANKELITFKRNGILQLVDSFTILYSKEVYSPQPNTEYTRLLATLKISFVPNQGDLLELTYPKSLELYNAASRIEDYYQPGPGMPGKELAQLMSGIEYSGLQVIGLPFDAAGGWDAQGIPWNTTPWDNLGLEEGYTSYSTTATSTQTFTIPSLIATGTQVNIYVKSATDSRVNGVRIDSTGTSSLVKTLIGLGTGAVSTVTMIIPGAGYNPSYTSASISSPNTLTGRRAQITATVVSGAIGVQVIDGGSGYTEPPVITIVESINPSNPTAQVTIQAFARAELKAEFREFGSTATTSTITVPSVAFTTSSTLVVLRYSTSDGTVLPTDPDSLDAIISGGDLGYTTALGVDPSEIILDGGSTSTRHITGMNDDGFLNPINSYAPEECVPGQIQESLGISVYTQPAATSPIIANRRYYVDGSTLIFQLGIRPTDENSVIATLNGRRMTANEYEIDYAASTFRIRTSSPERGWLSLTSLQLGAIKLLDTLYASTSSSQTILTSFIGFRDVGSTYVTVNGVKIASSATNYPGTYTFTNFKGAARITVNQPGAIQAYLFKGATKSFSEITDQTTVTSISVSSIPLNPLPGNVEPLHSQIIVTKNGARLNPPVTTYWQVENAQTRFDISESTKYPLGRIDLANLEVYVNGARVLPSRKWRLEQADSQIVFRNNFLSDGDVIAIVVKEGEDYLVQNGSLVLTTPSAPGDTFSITTFTNHDPSFIRSERFQASAGNTYSMQRPVVNSAYVWVTYAGRPLTVSLDYTVASDNRTITLREGIYQSSTDTVVVTSFADTEPTIAYRIFQDMLGRTHYKRLSEPNTTVLSQNLLLTDTMISVEDADKLTQPDPATNRPGVVLIDGERIEFFVRQGNVLRQLRRSTLGTGPKDIHYAGTLVVDQGATQTIPFKEQTYSTSTLISATGIIGFVTATQVTTATTNVVYKVSTGTVNRFVTGTNVAISGISSSTYNTIATIVSVNTGVAQTITVSYANTFTSSPILSSTSTMIQAGMKLADYITFNNFANFTDQVEVKYQGVTLLKPNLSTVVHDFNKAYDSTSSVVIDVPVEPSFDISSTTSILSLNFVPTPGSKLEVIKRTARIWYDLNSNSTLAKNTTPQAEFLSGVPAAIPRYLTSSTYIAKDLTIYLETNEPLTDENNSPLQGI